MGRGGRIIFAKTNMVKGLKVLVTGGAGFIASNLMLRLHAEGAIIKACLHKNPYKYLREVLRLSMQI